MKSTEFGKIERIRIYTAKGKEGTDLQEGLFIENKGLDGDYHALGGNRQISLLFTDVLKKTKAEKLSEGQGLCLSRFKENLSISGIECAAPGVKLSNGPVILEITEEIKHCHNECSLFENGKQCPLAGLNLFAKVLKSGSLRAGDEVTVT